MFLKFFLFFVFRCRKGAFREQRGANEHLRFDVCARSRSVSRVQQRSDPPWGRQETDRWNPNTCTHANLGGLYSDEQQFHSRR